MSISTEDLAFQNISSEATITIPMVQTIPSRHLFGHSELWNSAERNCRHKDIMDFLSFEYMAEYKETAT